jgi:hypothetical protein
MALALDDTQEGAVLLKSGPDPHKSLFSQFLYPADPATWNIKDVSSYNNPTLLTNPSVLLDDDGKPAARAVFLFDPTSNPMMAYGDNNPLTVGAGLSSANGITATQATTAAYVTLFAKSIQEARILTILLTETVGQDVMYSVDVSMDNALWINLKTNVVILANTSAFEVLTDPWQYLRVQIIDRVGGTHGSVSATIYGYEL